MSCEIKGNGYTDAYAFCNAANYAPSSAHAYSNIRALTSDERRLKRAKDAAAEVRSRKPEMQVKRIRP